MNINCHLALNNLSFGNCSFHILREMWKKNINVNWFPIGGNADFSAFDKAEPEFINWCQFSSNKAFGAYKKDFPTFRLWHINGSHEHVGANQTLFVFHETDELSSFETNILNQQKNIIVSSEETKNVFEQYGVTVPIYYIPLGFDNLHFKVLNKKYYSEDITVFSLYGKLEKRKAHAEVIRAWIRKFGNNPKYMLHLHINNTFLRPEDNDMLFNQIVEGKKYSNINRLPFVKTLSEVNDIYNSADIVIDMSRGEGFSLPSFLSVGLGKHAIIHNCSAMKGWANKDNSVLVEPKGKIKAVDNIFFHENSPFNIGNFYNWEEADLLNAFDEVLVRKTNNKLNQNGLKIQEEFKWENSVSKIIDVLNS